MGFFSWQCKKCDHSIKAPYQIPTGWEHMGQAVWVRDGKDPLIGDYDGYGRIDDREVNFHDPEPEMWHKKCWENAGKPEYTGGSDYASDQGYFYDDPSDEELLEAIRATE